MKPYHAIRERAFECNRQIPELGLAIYTFGNVSAFDPDLGLFAIKPSGVAYADLTPDAMVVLDLDNTELLDSDGLTALLNVFDKLREEEGEIKIATTSPTNQKILEITRLDQQLEVYPSVIEAVKSFH